jgi:pimeloyl-ACP methyl ester carboxylesterase
MKAAIFKSYRVSINGLDMYYEVRGQGEPLIMLHGAILVDLAPSIDILAEQFMVITPHLQGRGHTPDIDRPFSYEAMADDVAGLMRHMRISKADIFGQSMGAGVALRVAFRHRAAVERLVLVSTAMSVEGWHPKVRQELAEMEAKAKFFASEIAQSGLASKFPETDWERLFRKTGQFQQKPYDVTEQVGLLDVQTQLVFGDEDAIKPDHMIAFWKALGGGKGEAGLAGPERTNSRLAVIANTNHSTVLQDTAFVQTVSKFLQSAGAGRRA